MKELVELIIRVVKHRDFLSGNASLFFLITAGIIGISMMTRILLRKRKNQRLDTVPDDFERSVDQQREEGSISYFKLDDILRGYVDADHDGFFYTLDEKKQFIGMDQMKLPVGYYIAWLATKPDALTTEEQFLTDGKTVRDFEPGIYHESEWFDSEMVQNGIYRKFTDWYFDCDNPKNFYNDIVHLWPHAFDFDVHTLYDNPMPISHEEFDRATKHWDALFAGWKEKTC